MADPTLIKETVEAAQAAGPIGAFGLNGKIFVAQLVNFGLVLLVLWRFAYRPIVNMLEARSEKIEKSVKQAEEIEARMNASEVERDEMMKKARLTAQEVAKKAQEDAEARTKAMGEKARAEVEKIVVQGKAQLASEREEMLSQVRKEVAQMAILAAEKILGETIDKKKSEALAVNTLKEAGLDV